MGNPKVGTDTSAGPGKKNPKDSVSTGMKESHPAIRPQSSFKQRKRSGTDVPMPPKLNLP